MYGGETSRRCVLLKQIADRRTIRGESPRSIWPALGNLSMIAILKSTRDSGREEAEGKLKSAPPGNRGFCNSQNSARLTRISKTLLFFFFFVSFVSRFEATFCRWFSSPWKAPPENICLARSGFFFSEANRSHHRPRSPCCLSNSLRLLTFLVNRASLPPSRETQSTRRIVAPPRVATLEEKKLFHLLLSYPGYRILARGKTSWFAEFRE